MTIFVMHRKHCLIHENLWETNIFYFGNFGGGQVPNEIPGYASAIWFCIHLFFSFPQWILTKGNKTNLMQKVTRKTLLK